MDPVAEATERVQTIGEEIANSISHGIGLIAAIAATPVLLTFAVRQGDPLAVVGAGVFAFTVILLYAASTVYHAIPHYRGAKTLFQVLDHGAIYLLIAGTYTPFTLGVLNGPWGWTLLVLVWTMAIIGVALKSLGRVGHPVLSAIIYLAMGWIVLIAIKPLLLSMPPWGLFWLVSGGAAYTLGVVFFLLDQRVRYAHFVWHLFVLMGTACHFVAVLLYAA